MEVAIVVAVAFLLMPAMFADVNRVEVAAMLRFDSLNFNLPLRVELRWCGGASDREYGLIYAYRQALSYTYNQ